MRKWLLAALFLVATPVRATTRYVTKSGNNGNTCADSQNIGTAKLTVTAGLACMSAGDTLIIGDGVYGERIRNNVTSGSAGAPTIIKALNANGAILRPSDATLGDGWFWVIDIGNDGGSYS